MAGAGLIPGLIVVGVVNTDRGRDLSPVQIADIPNSGGGERFLRFLREELLPFVDARYRTSRYRLLFGHCLAGTFALHTLLHHPDAFEATLASSPYVDFDQVTFHKAAAERLAAFSTAGRALYLSVGDEPDFKPGFERVRGMLQARAPQGLRWEAQALAERSHEAVVHLALYHGLQSVFDGIALPDAVRDQGLAAIQAHYQGLNSRFGLSLQAPPALLNNTGFAFLQRKDYSGAIAILSHCVADHPDFWICHHNLAYGFQQTGDIKGAIQHYETSLKLNPDNPKARERLAQLKAGR